MSAKMTRKRGQRRPGKASKRQAGSTSRQNKQKAQSTFVALKSLGAESGRSASVSPSRSASEGSTQDPGTAEAKRESRELPSAQLLAAGKSLREKVPRKALGVFRRDKDNVDPLAILRAQDKGRMEQLIPIRYGRMLQSPFTFYRGAAAVMAADLAKSPTTGLRVQACGDCHLLNFGGFATPERNVAFDINDFDETLPGPWEWDVKRLVASFVLAARSQNLKDSSGRDAAMACARSYRERLREYSEMSPLEIWYARIDLTDLSTLAKGQAAKDIEARLRGRVAKEMETRGSDMQYPQLAGMVSGHIRIHDVPPLIFHPSDTLAEKWRARAEEGLKCYRETLSEDRRDLLDQYRFVDAAFKVVGIGSVGTYCAILLMMSANNTPLFLQWKQARQSVLEPYVGKSAYSHPGQRVVVGQKLMQSASDIFLGWATSNIGIQGYVRQLRDIKIKPVVEAMDDQILTLYAQACGWALARAHAKAGSSELTITGYLGNTDNFDEAMGNFAMAYANQTERDHAALKAAVRSGEIKVHLES